MSGNSERKILVVDNDADILVELERILEDGGYATTTAVNSADAHKLLSRGNFDLLVLDDYLSESDSVQMLAECRVSGIDVLTVVTFHRHPSRDEEKRMRALGANALVNKRAHTELVEIVNYLLNPRAAQYHDGFGHMT